MQYLYTLIVFEFDRVFEIEFVEKIARNKCIGIVDRLGYFGHDPPIDHVRKRIVHAGSADNKNIVPILLIKIAPASSGSADRSIADAHTLC